MCMRMFLFVFLCKAAQTLRFPNLSGSVDFLLAVCTKNLRTLITRKVQSMFQTLLAFSDGHKTPYKVKYSKTWKHEMTTKWLYQFTDKYLHVQFRCVVIFSYIVNIGILAVKHFSPALRPLCLYFSHLISKLRPDWSGAKKTLDDIFFRLSMAASIK